MLYFGVDCFNDYSIFPAAFNHNLTLIFRINSINEQSDQKKFYHVNSACKFMALQAALKRFSGKT